MYLLNHNNSSSRLRKFRLCLEKCDLYIEYVRGRDNVVTEALSRIKIVLTDIKGMRKNSFSLLTHTQIRDMNKVSRVNTIEHVPKIIGLITQKPWNFLRN